MHKKKLSGVLLVAGFLAVLLGFLFFVSRVSNSFLPAGSALLFVFSIGFLTQIVLSGGKKAFSRLSILLFIICLIAGLFPAKNESLSDYNLIVHFLVSVLVFGLFESVLLRDRILVKLDEFKLLLFSMLFSYVLYSYGARVFFLVSLLPLAVMLFFCFTRFTPGSRARLLLYAWFLLAWIGLGLILLQKFFFGVVLARLFSFLNFTAASFQPWDYFFFGMSSFILLSLAFYLFLLLPIPTKHETFKQALKRSREMAHSLVSKFDDRNASRLAAFLAVVFVGGFFAVNLLFDLFKPVVLIAFFLSASGLIDYVENLGFGHSPRGLK